MSQENEAQSRVRIGDLKAEQQAEPLGIQTAQPQFSWILDSDERGALQTAYQILVASSLEKLHADSSDKWDSGVVQSDNSVDVRYAGGALTSGERAYWKVRIWDQDGRQSAYSVPSYFEMGLLQANDWQAKWISTSKKVSSPILRRELTIDTPVRSARIYVSGLGYYELSINGQRVGDRLLDPASTYYRNDQAFKLGSRILYSTYDITSHLQQGANAIGVMLGHGWYSAETDPVLRQPYGDRPRVILRANIELVDGRRLIVTSDASWKASTGPITYNDMAHGEAYDAQLEQPGWDRPAFDDASWEHAQVVDEPQSSALFAQQLPPVRVTDTLPVAKVIKPRDPSFFPRTYIYDFGQNFSGWVRLSVSGPRGAKLTLRYGSRIYPEDLSLDTRSSNPPFGGARQTDTYVLKGEGVEVWEPRFTLHAFRYVEISGFKDTPSVQHIEGRVVRSALQSTGTFVSSNELLNRIHQNIRWTLLSSFQGIPQDAAERGERIAWLGDPGFTAEDHIYNYDMLAFWKKWLTDIRDTQKENGDIPFNSPLHWRGSDTYLMWPCWKSTYPEITWRLYQYYGDTSSLADNFTSIRKLVDFIGASARGHIISSGLGDHMEPQRDGFSLYAPQRTPAAFTSTACYLNQVMLVSQVAAALGYSGDAKRYAALAAKIRVAFNKRFFDATTNQYATGSQTCNALALSLGIVPRDKVAAVVRNLITDVTDRHDYHVSTGVIGSNALVNALPQYGATAIMYRLAAQTTYPSLGHQVLQGATTVCENYECAPWSSQNMKMFGSLDKFFYRTLAGIQPASPGFRHILIQPQPVEDLRSVRASHRTARGTIRLEWERADTGLSLRVDVPAGTEAEIVIPRLHLNDVQISEGKELVWRDGDGYVPGAPGVKSAQTDTESVTFRTGSGSFDFSLTGNAY